MAFSLRRLSVLAYANGFTLWHYKTATDELPHTLAPGHFDDASDMLSSGDIMMVSGDQGARMLMVAHRAGTITTAPMC